jgi:hypothetical protein
MKMVKSLLLGSAAGLVAVAGAQAADLPVKAKPVQYVKICSLYGVGFYYIPGTDTCIKLGGWVRLYTLWGANSDSTNGALGSHTIDNRVTGNFSWKTRGYITADVRNQSEYGTIRGYLDVGFSGDNAQAFSSNRAFIQFAGFTFGLSQSFYDFYSQPAVSYFGGHITPASDTGDAGQYVWAYTYQFGNGIAATLAAEAPTNNRRAVIWNTSIASQAPTPITAPGNSYGGVQWPDVVANVRGDWSWGSAQIMGAVHEVNGLYYGTTEGTGGPDAKVGWAVGAGGRINTPMIGMGDYFQAQVNYTQGATGYVAATNISYGGYRGNSYGFGLQTDGVYGAAGTSIELTTAWGVDASYEHFWNKQWQTSVYGSYIQVSYNGTATGLICTGVGGLGAAAGLGIPVATCDPDYSYWDIGSRTQFNLDANTYVGVDIVYTRLNTSSSGLAALPTTGTKPGGVYSINDQSAWTAEFRVHRNFYP